MSGKWVRSNEGSQPGAIVFLAAIGVVVSAAIGAVAVLWRAHLLSSHTPWRKVPAALWALKAYPIVYQPFVVGVAIGLIMTAVVVLSTLFTRQKLHARRAGRALAKYAGASCFHLLGSSWASSAAR